jgi:predicted SAM-dependent methyltransferase
MLKVNLGCGPWPLPGWVNVDFEVQYHPDVRHDLRNPLPWGKENVDFIRMEHFFEHILQVDGQRLLGECYRVLKWGGVIRINGPDLEKLAKLYLSRRYDVWRTRTTAPGETICDLMNDVFYNWGHQYIPDYPQFIYMLHKAGFRGVRRCEFGKSEIPELNNTEIRTMSPNEDSVIEGIK